MAKDKKSIELSEKKIAFEIKKVSYKVIRFYPSQMMVDVMAVDDGVKLGMQTLPFAHMPKEIKKIIKPN
ncbi:hypothetical protein [Sulfurimonas sp.]|uniref:hypothetical protein n=1 Tax=Sulfurimonas sp. TaxID=2022749 RepID=UPI0026006FEE|nr:hypothetical protein [Sulfurimonas sp.]MDD5157968.1 hypothetical protein [Sulfurimonas sp.]